MKILFAILISIFSALMILCYGNWILVFKNGTSAEVTDYQVQDQDIHVTNPIGVKFKFSLSEIDIEKTNLLNKNDPIQFSKKTSDLSKKPEKNEPNLKIEPNKNERIDESQFKPSNTQDRPRDDPGQDQDGLFGHKLRTDFTGIDRAFLSWTKKDCQRLVSRSTKGGNENFGRRFLKTYSSLPTKVKRIEAMWLTDLVMKAIARLTQIEDRQTPEFALRLYGSLLDEIKGSYLFLLESEDTVVFSGKRYGTYKGELDVERQQVIFLQHKRDKDRFARVKSMDSRHVKSFNLSSLYAQFGERVILAFNRRTDSGQPLVISLEDELEMEIPTKDAGTIRIRFKPADFARSLDEL